MLRNFCKCSAEIQNVPRHFQMLRNFAKCSATFSNVTELCQMFRNFCKCSGTFQISTRKLMDSHRPGGEAPGRLNHFKRLSPKREWIYGSSRAPLASGNRSTAP